MNGEIHKYFAEDHRRLKKLLESAFAQDGKINDSDYSEFRSGLLKHIALEEKILLPAIQKANDGAHYPSAAQFRLEHGAIAALMVLPPSISVKNVLLGILEHHNKREELIPGLYHDCDSALVKSLEPIMQNVRNYPDVPLMPYNNSQLAQDAARRAVARAGYDYDGLSGIK
jgi:hypothetical protein